MRVRERVAVLDDAGLRQALLPRNSVVIEVEEAPGVFSSANGPTRSYRRVVTPEPTDEGHYRVTQRVELEAAVPFWGWIFGPLLMAHLSKIGGPSESPPFWFPPDRMDEQASTTLARLGVFAAALGYMTYLLTQTITYAAEEFGADKGAQGFALASVRLDVLLSLPLALMADRRGRRRLLVGATLAACGLTALGALAPNLATLTVAQMLARGCANAASVTLAVMIAEEMPAGARAWSTSIMTVAAAFGGGFCVLALPLADTDQRGWRILFLLPLLAVPVIRRSATGLVETRRFVVHVERRLTVVRPWALLRDHRGRFLLLASSGLLLAMFATPASQFQNEFLRTERGFSGAQITLFIMVTSIPGGLGLLVGGWLAERGRRIVGATTMILGVGCTLAQFYSYGALLYTWSTIGSLFGAAAVPALGVYGAELFPTEGRGAANGGIGLASRVGSVIGLVVAGQLGDSLGLTRAFTYLAVGPVVLMILILVAYPETAHRELEDLNPEDEPV
jgi:predicted MFS family arabinose efflux permease